MAEHLIIGFDFGTTNSLITRILRDKAFPYLDEKQRPIPSIVSYEGLQVEAGASAKAKLGQAGLGVHGNIVRSPKAYLGDENIYFEGTQKRTVDVVSDLVTHVLNEAIEHPNDFPIDDLTGAVVTIPVDMQGYRRVALREAFAKANLRIIQFVHEPLAALYGHFRNQDNIAKISRTYDNQMILVFDWGGGTLDLTLVRLKNGFLTQIMNDGTEEVGGDIFDETIQRALIQQVMEEHGIDDSVQINEFARKRLLHACETAKITLSERETTTIYVQDFFEGLDDPDFDVQITTQELEEIVEPLIEKGLARIKNVLKNAHLESEQIALCLATGGMANMPMIKRRLYEWFSADRVHVPKGTGTLISEGAAWIAEDRRNLRLAKNVELAMARGSHLTIIPAETQMPYEGNSFGSLLEKPRHLYCTDPRDGTATVELESPVKPGRSVMPNAPRTSLATMTVEVDEKAKQFQERLELYTAIDHNLILHSRVVSLNKGSEDHAEIHNLEFGLKLIGDDSEDQLEDEGDSIQSQNSSQSNQITVRSNISAAKDSSLLPGDYLYSINPRLAHRDEGATKLQVEESLYYKPCSLCGLKINDPACQCGSQI